MYGLYNITTMFSGPIERIKPGRYDSKIVHLTVLATVLDMYGALEGFKADFSSTWGAATHPINAQWVGGTHPVRQKELVAQLANLKPVDSFRI